MFVEIEYSALKFFAIFTIQAVAFLMAAVYSLASVRRGASAVIGALGSIVGAASAGVLAVGWAKLEYAEDNVVFDYMATHEAAGNMVDWGLTAGITFVCAALVILGRRSARGPRL